MFKTSQLSGHLVAVGNHSVPVAAHFGNRSVPVAVDVGKRSGLVAVTVGSVAVTVGSVAVLRIKKFHKNYLQLAGFPLS